MEMQLKHHGIYAVVDVMGLVVCGSVRTWIPGQEAMDRLIEHVLKGRRVEG